MTIGAVDLVTVKSDWRSSAKATQILEAAGRLFMEQGYSATSMDAIARQANVSKATLYTHFAGKEDLFSAVIDDRCRTQLDDRRLRQIDQLDPVECLSRLGRSYLDLLMSQSALAIFRVVIAEQGRCPELGHLFFLNGPARVHGEVGRQFRRLTETGALACTDPQLAAEQFLGMLKSPLHLRALLGSSTPDEAAIEQVLNSAVAVILRAYAPG